VSHHGTSPTTWIAAEHAPRPVPGQHETPHGTAHEAGSHSGADAIDLAAQVASTMRLMGETAAEAAARIARAGDPTAALEG
jgi:hypothetical protein